MHSITHLIESIKDKGVTANTSTDSGEALHLSRVYARTYCCWTRGIVFGLYMADVGVLGMLGGEGGITIHAHFRHFTTKSFFPHTLIL